MTSQSPSTREEAERIAVLGILFAQTPTSADKRVAQFVRSEMLSLAVASLLKEGRT